MSVLINKLIADIKSAPNLSEQDLLSVGKTGLQALEELYRRRHAVILHNINQLQAFSLEPLFTNIQIGEKARKNLKSPDASREKCRFRISKGVLYKTSGQRTKR